MLLLEKEALHHTELSTSGQILRQSTSVKIINKLPASQSQRTFIRNIRSSEVVIYWAYTYQAVPTDRVSFSNQHPFWRLLNLPSSWVDDVFNAIISRPRFTLARRR